MSFDPSRDWPLQERHQRLPKWARLELAAGICAMMNEGMAPDYREAARRAFGGNCTFGDDDMAMLEHFAAWAVDQGYRADINDRATLLDMDAAQAERTRDRDASLAEDPKGLSAEQARAAAQPHRPASISQSERVSRLEEALKGITDLLVATVTEFGCWTAEDHPKVQAARSALNQGADDGR